MTPVQIARNRVFIKDLRNNVGKESTYFMRTTSGRRSCLCVALDSAISCGFVPPSPVGSYTVGPPAELSKFYGWPSKNPSLLDKSRDGPLHPSVITLNNMVWFSHDKIADAFENTFPTVKPPSTG